MAVQPRGRPAKFSVPNQPRDLLHRPRLVDFLHENIHLKLLLVSATAGYGKTSLVTDFVHDTDYPVAWFHIDESDADLATLVSNICLSLQTVFPSFKPIVPALAAQPNAKPKQLATALNREIESALPDPFVLVLDDFQLVEETPAVVQFFDELLRTLPEHAHLVLIGRTVPPLRLSALAARQQIAGLSDEHLRFKPSEIKQLLSLRGTELPDADAERIAASTDGWITGILLTTHLMWQGLMANLVDVPRSAQPLYDYLADEVLDRQSPELRQFLLESAVLPEMEPPVCDAILGRSDSAKFLRQAADHRLFITAIGDENPTYQYHPLFREFLLSRLRAHDQRRMQDLQMGAARWYAAHNMPEAAVTFFLLSNAPGEAAIVAERHADPMFITGRYDTIRRWVEQLAGQSEETPLLRLGMAKVKTPEGKLDEALADLEQSEAGFKRRRDALGVLRVDLQRSYILFLRGAYVDALALARGAALTAQGLGAALQEAGALRYAGISLRALDRLPEAEAALEQSQAVLRNTPHRFDRAAALNDLARVLRTRGQTSRANEAQREALDLYREIGTPGQVAIALNNIAWDLHMLGAYDAAMDSYYQASEWARRSGVARVEVAILTNQALLLADLGDTRHAMELCRQALSRSEAVEDPTVMADVYVQLARLDRLRGEYASAQEWIRRAALALSRDAENPPAGIAGLHGVILVEQGEIDRGLQVLQRACAELDKAGAQTDLVQALFFRSYAEFKHGNADAAAATLAQALESAAKIGYDRLLVAEALPLAPYLRQMALRSDVGGQAADLLRRGEKTQSMRDAVEARATPLASEKAGASPIRVRALGRSSILKQNEETPREDWAALRTREVFFFLLDNAPVKRDRVLEVFWPDQAQARAGANLNMTLYRIRKALGQDIFVLEGQSYVLLRDVQLEYDVKTFELAAKQALASLHGARERGALLATAFRLYTGEFLADLPVDWAQSRRRELVDLFLRLVYEYGKELNTLTRYIEARQVLEQGLVVDPYEDQLHEQMLTCLGKLGRRSAVIDHYVRYRERLRSEFGLEPPSSITALYSRLIQ